MGNGKVGAPIFDVETVKLERRFVEKPWGRTELPGAFESQGKRIGEVWFTGADFPLLAKYLFTSEKLSVQVHPSDEQARARGLLHGKTECWYIVEAEEGATIGLGPKREVPADELEAAARDGSIGALLDWRPVKAGDFLFVPPGTIHAIGAGISLIEIQQDSDVTYRLYDYGRPRELHLDDGLAVATRSPYPAVLAQDLSGSGPCRLVDGPPFIVDLATDDALIGHARLVLPIDGEARAGADIAAAGECLLLGADERLDEAGGRMLIAASC
jgi:mannose-6-phosphate isomerase